MATIGVNTCAHATLTANVADTVTFADDGVKLTVTNRGVTNPLFVSIGSTAAEPAAATVAGDGCYVVVGSRDFSIPENYSKVVVSVIAAGTMAYSAEIS